MFYLLKCTDMMKCNNQEFNCDKNQHNMNLPCWHAFLDVSIGLQLNLRLWRILIWRSYQCWKNIFSLYLWFVE